MIEGDANGRGFQYPIPTYSITKNFDWSESENNKLLFEMAAKYGTPYFSNYINSDMEPSDVRSMCCRLRLDLRELRKKSGGFFGSGESTGSIGVVTLNMQNPVANMFIISLILSYVLPERMNGPKGPEEAPASEESKASTQLRS